MRGRIVETARALLDTPFKHQGRQPGLGLDCVGLVLCVGRTLGLTAFDVTNYPRLPQGDRLLAFAQAAGFSPCHPGAAGDVAVLRLARDPQHVAILTDRGMLHACQRVGRVIEHRLDAAWRRRIVATYRYPGIG